MSEHDYDVVIVGAGITGAILAKELASRGRSVLILEAGRFPGHPVGSGSDQVLGDDLDYDSGATLAAYRGFLETYYGQAVKVPNSPYPGQLTYDPSKPDAEAAPSANLFQINPWKKDPDNPLGPDVLTGAGSYLVQTGPRPFASDYTRNGGGTTLHWLGTCLRMLPNDFQLLDNYGHGANWPIGYDDLRPWYERAEREIGVAGDVSEQIYPGAGKNFWGEGYVLPMLKIPQSYQDQYLARGIEGMKVAMGTGDNRVEVDMHVRSTPQGRNSIPHPNYVYRDPVSGKELHGYEPVGAVGDPYIGQRCEGNSSCVPICPVQAKYNALKTLHAALETGKVHIRPQSVASDVVLDPSGKRVMGIKYIPYLDGPDGSFEKLPTKTATGKIYVIAAHAIASAKLLLASNNGDGVANRSDQVGRNLMDHPCLLNWGLLPENIGAFRGPGSTSGSPSFRDGKFRHDHSAFIVEIGNWGWNWPAFAPGADVDKHVGNLFGSALRDKLADELPRQFRIAWEAEQIAEPNNRVTIGKNLDKIGLPRPVISYDLPLYTRKGLAAGQEVWDQLCHRLNIEDHSVQDPTDPSYFELGGRGYVYRGAGHVVGTHRMGDDGAHSVVDPEQRSHDHENLFMVGCGNMPTLATSNPTLTISALTFWAAKNIHEQLARG